jgi:glucokinase
VTTVLAIDCGGTRVKAAAVTDGRVGDVRTADVGGSDADAALAAVVDVGRAILSDTPCDTVALCVPGLVDEHGVVVSLPGKFPGIEGRDLPGELTSGLGLPAVVVNDAVAYGVGEATDGAGRGHRSVVVVTIGTGVGVCVVHDLRPAGTGVCGGGILGGQIPISEATDGPVDTSGRPDSIEAFCRADRIVAEAGPGFASVPDVYDAYAKGHPAAVQGIASYRSHLARAVTALAHAHAPNIVVLGGGPMTPGNPVIDGLSGEVDARTWPGYRVRIAVAALGDAAGLVGLATLAT